MLNCVLISLILRTCNWQRLLEVGAHGRPEFPHISLAKGVVLEKNMLDGVVVDLMHLYQIENTFTVHHVVVDHGHTHFIRVIYAVI